MGEAFLSKKSDVVFSVLYASVVGMAKRKVMCTTHNVLTMFRAKGLMKQVCAFLMIPDEPWFHIIRQVCKEWNAKASDELYALLTPYLTSGQQASACQQAVPKLTTAKCTRLFPLAFSNLRDLHFNVVFSSWVTRCTVSTWNCPLLERLLMPSVRVSQGALDTIAFKFTHLQSLTVCFELQEDTWVVSNFAQLRVLRFTDCAQKIAMSILITNLPMLTTVDIQTGTYHKLLFEDVPLLHTITSQRQHVTVERYIFKNAVPELRSVSFASNSRVIDPYNHVNWKVLADVSFSFSKGHAFVFSQLKAIAHIDIVTLQDLDDNLSWSKLFQLERLHWRWPSTTAFGNFADTFQGSSLTSLFLLWGSETVIDFSRLAKCQNLQTVDLRSDCGGYLNLETVLNFKKLETLMVSLNLRHEDRLQLNAWYMVHVA